MRPIVRPGSHVAVFGTQGTIAGAKDLSIEDLLRRAGDNTGNLMFQRAAPSLFAEETRPLSTLSGPEAEAVLADAKALVFPAANHLRRKTDWTGLAARLKEIDVPLIVLGLGSQAPSAGSEAATIAALKDDPSVRALGEAIAERAVLVTVRGPFSAKVCRALGIEGAVPLGCPSLFLNPRPDLGRAIAWRLGQAREKGDAARMCLAAAAPFEIQSDADKLAAEQVLFAATIPNRGLIVQQSGGVATAALAKGAVREVTLGATFSMRRILAPEMSLDDFVELMKTRGRLFTDATQWIEALKPFDAVVGTRLHGNMAALAAAVPGAVVTHDSRTAELVETMALPTLTLREVTEAGSLAEILQRIRFDADAFDANRRRIARGLSDAFGAVGLNASEGVAALAA